MNDLPIHELPPNALQRHRLNSGDHFPAEDGPTDVEKFDFMQNHSINLSLKLSRKSAKIGTLD